MSVFIIYIAFILVYISRSKPNIFDRLDTVMWESVHKIEFRFRNCEIQTFFHGTIVSTNENYISELYQNKLNWFEDLSLYMLYISISIN